MEALAYLNNRFIDLEELALPLEERGLQFGDSIYEVVRIYNGKPFTLKEHLERLNSSAQSILLQLPKSLEEIAVLVREGIEKINLQDGTVYIQLTRGNAPRNHPFPREPKENLMLIWKKNPEIRNNEEAAGINIITVDDDRWKNCFIKTTCLLPNVLAKEKALRQNAFEALFIRDEYLKECTSMNIFLVQQGIIKTPLPDHSILNGITRQVVINLAHKQGLKVEETNLTIEDLRIADEVFVTSTTKELVPVIKVDEFTIGKGKPGNIFEILHKLFKEHIREQCSSNISK